MLTDFNILIIVFGIIVILETLILNYMWYQKSSYSKILVLIILGYTLVAIWVFLSIYLNIYGINYENWYIKIISDSLIILGAYCLTSSVSLIFYNKISLFRSIFFSTLFASQLELNVIIYINFHRMSGTTISLSYLFILLIPLSLIVIIYVDYKNNRVIGNNNENLELLTFKNSTYILFLSIPVFIYTIINTDFPVILGYFSVLIISFIESIIKLKQIENTKFYVRANNFTVFVRTDSGNLIYYKEFIKEEDSLIKNLLSNWLTAFSSIITQFLDVDVKPLEIRLEADIRIIFHWSNNLNIAVIVDTISPLIRPAMRKLVNEINNEIISKNKISSAEELEIEKLVLENFKFAL